MGRGCRYKVLITPSMTRCEGELPFGDDACPRLRRQWGWAEKPVVVVVLARCLEDGGATCLPQVRHDLGERYTDGWIDRQHGNGCQARGCRGWAGFLLRNAWLLAAMAQRLSGKPPRFKARAAGVVSRFLGLEAAEREISQLDE